MKTLDPRTLLWVVAILSTVTVFTRSLIVQLLLFCGLVILLIVLRIPLRKSFNRIKKMVPIILFVVVAQSVFTPGDPLIGIYEIAIISEQGLIAGAMTMFRLFILAASALLFTLTSESDMIHALSLLKIPDEIAFMSLIALRFLPDYVKEYQLCLESFELRGVNIKQASLRQKATMLQTFVTPVLIRSLFKAKRLAMSMELRGFKAQPTRTSLHTLSLSKWDMVVMGFSLIIGLALMIGEQFL
jgi:energy-coupling factor transport system permease protein